MAQRGGESAGMERGTRLSGVASQRFYGSIKGKPELVEAVTAVRELVDLELKHAKLTKYSKN